jgi:hypothetical protein
LPGAPSTLSAPAGTPSRFRFTQRVARSMPVTGVCLKPAAPGSTRNSVRPSGARAGTRITSATCAHATNGFTPESFQPWPDFSARVVMASGAHDISPSSNATDARAPPAATAGSQRVFCASEPAWVIAIATSTVGRYGPG